MQCSMDTSVVSSSSAWLSGVVQIFAVHGIDPEHLFQQAALDSSRLKDPHARFTSQEINRLWELALAWTGAPTLALDRQLCNRYINFDIAAQAMWPGPLLRHGLESLSRYLSLIGDAASFAMEPVLEGAWLTLAHGRDGSAPRQRLEFGMLALLMLCRRVTRRPMRPYAAEFTSGEPADYHPYRMAFACPLRFGQPAHRMLLGTEDLALPLAITSTSLFALHEQVIEERLARSGVKSRTTWRVSETIIRELHLGEPSLRDVARQMGTSEAALQQKLQSERTSFERILDEVRRELAEHYLSEPDFALARVPALLGFPTAAALSAACQRWFGLTPVAYRHLHIS